MLSCEYKSNKAGLTYKPLTFSVIKMFLLHSLVLCGLLGVGLSWKQPSCYLTKGTSTEEIGKIRESMENGFSALTEVLQQLAGK